MQQQTNVLSPWIVAIGASAGGLDALGAFFRACPADLDAAYVVIQHLSPDYKSMMNDLLSRHTDMPVVMITSGLKPLPNNVYLIPPGTTIEITDGHFVVSKKPPHILSLPIDIFFRSAAAAYKTHCVGLVLSGTGSDGTRGALAINNENGLVLAQMPEEAAFDGMPNSVIATGIVDDVMRVTDMPAKIAAFMTHPFGKELPTVVVDSVDLSIDADSIFALLSDKFAINFHDYKRATVMRRIARRMQVRQVHEHEQYYRLLTLDDNELNALRRELLIPVTSFFRDKEVYRALQQRVIDTLVTQADPVQGIRCWVAGVSTGEEAYSLIMLFLEAFEKLKLWVPLKVFATDVNQDNIEIAGIGHYAEAIAGEVSPERLQRFFEKTDSGYKVKQSLRQHVVFARHNLLTDAPFTRMNLVSCRNTLIYFTAEAQQLVMQKLEFAVIKQGYLLLGTSESIANRLSEFDVVEPKQKIFCRRHESNNAELRNSFVRNIATKGQGHISVAGRGAALNPDNWVEMARSHLIKAFAPPALLVDDTGRVLHFYGPVQRLMRIKEGVADLTLNRILPDRLVPVASALLHKAKREQLSFTSDPVKMDKDSFESLSPLVTLSIAPLDQANNRSCFLIVFQETRRELTEQDNSVSVSEEIAERIDSLEVELQATRESLQTSIEELETSNEELQATNEELMAANEELQSSNEELQSVNEELNTVNAEYHEKMGLLNRINADLDSMSRASGIATLFLDNKLMVTRFTSDAVKVFKIREQDLGRPLDEIVNTLDYPGLLQDLQHTLDTARGMEREVKAEGDLCYLVRMLPYRITSTGLMGVVVSCVDVTALKRSQQLQAVVDALPEHVAVLDRNGTIVLVNAAWEQFARVNGDPALTHTGLYKNYLDVCRANIDDEDARAAFLGVKSVLEGTQMHFSMRYPCHSPDEQRWFVMNVMPIKHSDFAVVVSHFNVTAWVDNHE